MDKIIQDYESSDDNDDYNNDIHIEMTNSLLIPTHNDQSDSDDDTLSQLDVNGNSLTSNLSEQRDYKEIIKYVQTEEQKLIIDLNRNKQLIPDRIKKGRCDLAMDTVAHNYFKNNQTKSSHFIFYLNQRKTSQQSIESSINHCCQFIYYVKSIESNLKTINDIRQLLVSICTTYPTLTHSYFDYLYDNNLQASTILSRIDSLVVLFDWMKLNSNDVIAFRDVSKLSFNY